MKIENLQKIYESNKTTIYKGRYQDYPQDVIIKILNLQYPTIEQKTRFYNEYYFTKNLNFSGIRKVIKKDTFEGKNILILEHFDGENLSKFDSKHQTDLKELLQVASNIAQTLGEIHLQNIIHKDINSNNIFCLSLIKY